MQPPETPSFSPQPHSKQQRRTEQQKSCSKRKQMLLQRLRLLTRNSKLSLGVSAQTMHGSPRSSRLPVAKSTPPTECSSAIPGRSKTSWESTRPCEISWSRHVKPSETRRSNPIDNSASWNGRLPTFRPSWTLPARPTAFPPNSVRGSKKPSPNSKEKPLPNITQRQVKTALDK